MLHCSAGGVGEDIEHLQGRGARWQAQQFGLSFVGYDGAHMPNQLDRGGAGRAQSLVD